MKCRAHENRKTVCIVAMNPWKLGPTWHFAKLAWIRYSNLLGRSILTQYNNKSTHLIFHVTEYSRELGWWDISYSALAYRVCWILKKIELWLHSEIYEFMAIEHLLVRQFYSIRFQMVQWFGNSFPSKEKYILSKIRLFLCSHSQVLRFSIKHVI